MASSNDDFRTKYRPRRYDQMWQGVNYPAIKRLREEERRGRYPRGMIFWGDYGCGKTTAGRIRGLRTSCWQFRDDPVEPCGQCHGCQTAITERNGPDYFEMDATHNKLRSQMDAALRNTNITKLHSNTAAPRVFFLDEAHRADPKTQETMLKVIEDHQEAVFILSTTQPDKIDIALRKRCSLYQFEAPPAAQVVQHLQRVAEAEKLYAEPGVFELIADRKRCVPRDCLGVLYDLSFEGREFSLSQVEAFLAAGEESQPR
jgi:DNA polymerase-3 subunit gamma/tau